MEQYGTLPSGKSSFKNLSMGTVPQLSIANKLPDATAKGWDFPRKGDEPSSLVATIWDPRIVE